MSAKYTIEELADLAALTVRNVRAYQSRGLVGSPTIEGRTGYYDGTHLAQLRLVTQLQADGFNLAAIKRVSESTFGADVLWVGLTPLARAGLERRPEVVALCTANGLLRRAESGELQGLVAHRNLVWELVTAGLPIDDVITLIEAATLASEAVAARYAEILHAAVTQLVVTKDAEAPGSGALLSAAVNLLTSMFGASVGFHTVERAEQNA